VTIHSPNLLQPCDILLPRSVADENGNPYCLFFVDDFLRLELKESLSAEFPENLLRNRMGQRLAVSVDLEDGTDDVELFLASSSIWRSYLQVWKSKEVLDDLIQLFGPRMRDRYVSWWRPLMVHRMKRRSRLNVTVSLSAYRTGFRLTPHSDDKFKLLSLIHYLPVAESAANGHGGTVFYQPRRGVSRRQLRTLTDWSKGLRRLFPLWLAPSLEASLDRRYLDTDQLNSGQQSEFAKLFAELKYVGYQDNRLSGFVKNDWSMHEVNLENFPEGELRRAVIINVRLQPTLFYRAITPIEQCLAKVKRVFSK